MMVSAVLGLFLAMVGRAVVMAFRVHQATVRKTAAYRDATIAMARLFREISTCREWVNPPTGSGWLTPTTANKVFFYRNDANSFREDPVLYPWPKVQYWYDQPSHEIRRLDPQEASGYRTVAREVESFQVDVQEPIARFRVQVYGLDTPVELSAQAPRM